MRLELGAAPEGPAAHITDMSLLEVLVGGGVVGRPPFSPPLHFGILSRLPLPLPVLDLALVARVEQVVLVLRLLVLVFVPVVVLGGNVGVAVDDVHVDLEVVVLHLHAEEGSPIKESLFLGITSKKHIEIEFMCNVKKPQMIQFKL